MFLFKIGLIINILVAGGLGASLINKNLHIKVYGEDSASRQILSSLYLAIAILSIYALFNEDKIESIVFILFPFQIIYKVLTTILIRNKRNPVIWANLLISLYFLVSLYLYN